MLAFSTNSRVAQRLENQYYGIMVDTTSKLERDGLDLNDCSVLWYGSAAKMAWKMSGDQKHIAEKPESNLLAVAVSVASCERSFSKLKLIKKNK